MGTFKCDFLLAQLPKKTNSVMQLINMHQQISSYFYLSDVLPDSQVSNCDSSLGVKVLSGHVEVINIFVLILIFTAVILDRVRKKFN